MSLSDTADSLILSLRCRRPCCRSELSSVGISASAAAAFAIYATSDKPQSWIDVFSLRSETSKQHAGHAKTSGSHAAFRPGDNSHIATLRDWTVQLSGGIDYVHSSTVLVRDYASGKTVSELKEASAAPLVWSRDGKLLAAAEPGGEGGRMGVWDARSGVRVGRVVSHIDTVTHAAFTPDAELVTLSRDGTLRISNARTSRTTSRLELALGAGGPRALAVSPDGSSIIAIWGTTVHLWLPLANHVTSYGMATVRRTEGWPLCVSSDARWLVCRTEDGFDIMDVASGTTVYAQRSDVLVTAAEFKVDGEEMVLVLGRMDGVVEVWDVEKSE